MRRRLLLGLVPAIPAALVGFAACADAPVHVGIVMLVPHVVVDLADAMTLSVFDAGHVKCRASGHVDDMPSGEAVQTFELEKTGCPGGASWCKTIELDKDESKKMFAVVAKNAGGILGEGCATARIDQDPLDVVITMKRYNPPGCCNDGALQSGEQCDVGNAAAAKCEGVIADAVCEADCTAREILLSVDDPDKPMPEANGAPRTKSALAMAFGPGGTGYPNALRAVYTNVDSLAKGGADVNERFLAQDLTPIVDPYPLSKQLRIPIRCASVSGGGSVRRQDSPAIAVASADTVAVVYRSDEKLTNAFDVFLSPQTAGGCADTHPCADASECATGQCSAGECAAAQKVNAQGGGVSAPRVAGGPDGAVLVTWTLANSVYGRIWRTTGTLLPDDGERLIAANATGARVAGDPTGWRVVYQGAGKDAGSGKGDGDGVFLKTVSASFGIGDEVLVNAVTDGPQDQPDVATLDDGRTVVVWRSAGDIFFQRFGVDGARLERDQDAPLNTATEGTQQNPAVAASVGFGEFYAVAWETVETADIAARFVGAGATRFGYNSVSGQNDAFPATSGAVSTGKRTFPAVAIGGLGFVVIGWQDGSDEHPGVYVRRFPMPDF